MRQLLALQKALDEVDGGSWKTLESRIAFQKLVYLIQAFGLRLGYKFAWNQYGPYSQELAQDGHAIEAERAVIEARIKGLAVRTEAKEVLDKVRAAQEVPEEAGMRPAAWLELLASTHYLFESERVPMTPGDAATDERVTEEMTRIKPYFTADQVSLAIERIRAFVT